MSVPLPIESDKETVILQAARKRFDHYGLGKTTMNEIAADIGMSKASLYYYYPDKEHLFLAVIRKESDEFLKQLDACRIKPDKSAKKLKSYITIRHNYFKKLVSLAKVDEQSMATLKASAETHRQNMEEREKELVHLILKQGIKEGEFKSCNAKSIADLFVTTMRGLRVAIIHKKNLVDTKEEDYQASEKYQQQLVAIFLKSLSKA